MSLKQYHSLGVKQLPAMHELLALTHQNLRSEYMIVNITKGIWSALLTDKECDKGHEATKINRRGDGVNRC